MASFIIAGGGTGGHIFPAVAIGQALVRLRPDARLLFVGAQGRMEMEKVPQAGFEIVGLDIAGFNRSNLLANWKLPFKLFRSMMAARKLIRERRPQCVVGVGGYASFPMLAAAQRMGIPTLIQEQNSFAGKSNQRLGRRAARVCVAYEGMEQFFPKDRVLLTGNPVRQTIARMDVSKADGLAHFGLREGKTTLLIVGGSLGAKSVNEGIAAGLGALLANDSLQIVWQTGKPYHPQALEAARPFGDRVQVLDFIREMEYSYAAADVVISRAGALAIAELCIAAKPVLFVPYPHAAEDHQTSNARALVSRNAATMIADHEVSTRLVPEVQALLQNGALQATFSKNLKALAIADADERIAREVLSLSNLSAS